MKKQKNKRQYGANKRIEGVLIKDYGHLLHHLNTVRCLAFVYNLVDCGSKRVVKIDGITVAEGTTVSCDALAFAYDAHDGKKHFAMYARLDFSSLRCNQGVNSHPAHYKWVPVTVFDLEQAIRGFA